MTLRFLLLLSVFIVFPLGASTLSDRKYTNDNELHSPNIFLSILNEHLDIFSQNKDVNIGAAIAIAEDIDWSLVPKEQRLALIMGIIKIFKGHIDINFGYCYTKLRCSVNSHEELYDDLRRLVSIIENDNSKIVSFILENTSNIKLEIIENLIDAQLMDQTSLDLAFAICSKRAKNFLCEEGFEHLRILSKLAKAGASWKSIDDETDSPIIFTLYKLFSRVSILVLSLDDSFKYFCDIAEYFNLKDPEILTIKNKNGQTILQEIQEGYLEIREFWHYNFVRFLMELAKEEGQDIEEISHPKYFDIYGNNHPEDYYLFGSKEYGSNLAEDHPILLGKYGYSFKGYRYNWIRQENKSAEEILIFAYQAIDLKKPFLLLPIIGRIFHDYDGLRKNYETEMPGLLEELLDMALPFYPQLLTMGYFIEPLQDWQHDSYDNVTYLEKLLRCYNTNRKNLLHVLLSDKYDPKAQLLAFKSWFSFYCLGIGETDFFFAWNLIKRFPNTMEDLEAQARLHHMVAKRDDFAKGTDNFNDYIQFIEDSLPYLSSLQDGIPIFWNYISNKKWKANENFLEVLKEYYPKLFEIKSLFGLSLEQYIEQLKLNE